MWPNISRTAKSLCFCGGRSTNIFKGRVPVKQKIFIFDNYSAGTDVGIGSGFEGQVIRR